MSEPLKTPLPHPATDCTPPPRPPLTPEETTKYTTLLARARSFTSIPSTVVPASPLTPSERQWLTRECLLRYLRATKWSTTTAETRLLATLAWRRDFSLDRLTPEYISPENETGKQAIVGYDNEGRPCLYLSPGRQNTQPSHRQVEHLAFMVERVIDLLPPGQETIALLINFKASKGQKSAGPSLSMAKECLDILQNHYPERLGRALIINVPWVIKGFFTLITPFIDPRTVTKLKFNEAMSAYVPATQLWSEFDTGTLNFEYDHSIYWPALWSLCQERVTAKTALWEQGGSHVGEHEDYLLGGDDKGLLVTMPAVEEKKDGMDRKEVETSA